MFIETPPRRIAALLTTLRREVNRKPPVKKECETLVHSSSVDKRHFGLRRRSLRSGFDPQPGDPRRGLTASRISVRVTRLSIWKIRGSKQNHRTSLRQRPNIQTGGGE